MRNGCVHIEREKRSEPVNLGFFDKTVKVLKSTMPILNGQQTKYNLQSMFRDRVSKCRLHV